MAQLKSNHSELVEFKKAIKEKYQIHIQAFEDCSAEPIVEHFFTEDAMWDAGGYDLVIGRDELKPHFEAVVKGHHVSYESIRSFVKGDVGWDFGTYPVVPRDGSEPWTFKAMFNWVRIEGEWFVNACAAWRVEN